MGIEDIPEMEVIDDVKKVRIKPSKLADTGGKFVTMRGANNQNYVFAASFFLGQHRDLASEFERRAHDEYNCDEKFSPTGGGYLSIDGRKATFHGISASFGKYDERVVRSIAEKWKKQNLPKHKLVFK